MHYVTSERRSPRAKEDFGPHGLRRFLAAASLLVSHRALWLCSFLAPRCSPKIDSQRDAITYL